MILSTDYSDIVYLSSLSMKEKNNATLGGRIIRQKGMVKVFCLTCAVH
jgi:hypothetical protein